MCIAAGSAKSSRPDCKKLGVIRLKPNERGRIMECAAKKYQGLKRSRAVAVTHSYVTSQQLELHWLDIKHGPSKLHPLYASS